MSEPKRIADELPDLETEALWYDDHNGWNKGKLVKRDIRPFGDGDRLYVLDHEGYCPLEEYTHWCELPPPPAA